MSITWQLAIECSSTGGSLALFHNSNSDAAPALHSQIVLPSDQRSVRTLAPALRELLTAARLTVNQLEFLSVTVGPGSFTGLRVGLATAKMLALAGNLKVVPVDSLAAIAQRFATTPGLNSDRPRRLVTAINAFRKQVFTANWSVHPEGIRNLRPSSVVDAEAWLNNPWGDATSSPQAELANALQNKSDVEPAARVEMESEPAEPSELWISGSALATYPVMQSSMWQLRLAPAEIWQPLAVQVGELGWQQYVSGHAVSAAELTPNYIRESAAEEKRKLSTQSNSTTM